MTLLVLCKNPFLFILLNFILIITSRCHNYASEGHILKQWCPTAFSLSPYSPQLWRQMFCCRHIWRMATRLDNTALKIWSAGCSLMEKFYANHKLLENLLKYCKFVQNLEFCQFLRSLRAAKMHLAGRTFETPAVKGMMFFLQQFYTYICTAGPWAQSAVLPSKRSSTRWTCGTTRTVKPSPTMTNHTAKNAFTT